MTISKINKGLRFVIMLAAGMITASGANAASVTYVLNINNVFTAPGADDFVYVTVEDGTGGHADDIKFTVDANESLFDTYTNFGIQSFGFNKDTTMGLDFTTLAIDKPAGWSTDTNRAQDGYGKFDLVVLDGGSSRQDPLMFWITGVTGDTIDTYTLASQNTSNTDYWFAAHVTDFNTGEYGWRLTGSGDNCNQGDTNCVYQLLTSAYFSGGDGSGGGPPAGIVPVPAAVWLFGSGLLGLVGVARRRKSS